MNGRFHSLQKKVSSKVTEIFHNILLDTQEAAEEELNSQEKKCLNTYLGESPINSPRCETKAVKRAGVLKQRVKFISKILVMQKILREEHEMILQIKSQNNNKLPRGLLTEGKEAMEVFLKVAEEDSVNERIPY